MKKIYQILIPTLFLFGCSHSVEQQKTINVPPQSLSAAIGKDVFLVEKEPLTQKTEKTEDGLIIRVDIDGGVVTLLPEKFVKSYFNKCRLSSGNDECHAELKKIMIRKKGLFEEIARKAKIEQIKINFFETEFDTKKTSF